MLTLHRLFPDITVGHVAAEAKRERALRRRFYPGRVETLRMTQAEADFQLAIAAAWVEDVARIEGFHAKVIANLDARGRLSTIIRHDPAKHGCSWKDRRAALGREIELRRRVYPRHVEEARITPEDAKHRLACLEALAARYDDGFDWTASNGAFPHFATMWPTDAEIQARAEFALHAAEIEAARRPQTQQALSL